MREMRFALHCEPMDALIGSVRSPLLIGRDSLLELADRRLDDVELGRGQFLLVGGSAGIGKSRLLWAIGRKARERGFLESWGHLQPLDVDMPAASIRDLARTAASTPELAEAGRDILALLDVAAEANTGGRRKLALQVVDRLLAVPDRPVLYCFEDVQWADDLSLDVISELARRSRDRSILIMAGYRSDELEPGSSLRDWRSRLVTQRIAEELRLGPLSEAETALVTTLILDSGLPAPRDVAAAVYARTDGIPLYIEELLGALSADARANGRAIREAIVPDTIEDAVISRLRHRSTEAQVAARAGAVIGRCFTAEVLAEIMDVSLSSLEAPLQELCDAFLLSPPGDDGYFDFPHQLLREAVYRSVKVGDRRRYHARAGEFGSRLVGQSEIHASAHFERAGMHREAFTAALSGARDAARMSLHREAHDLYRRAVVHMSPDLPSLERASILEEAFYEAYAIEENGAADVLGRRSAAAYRAAGEVAKAISVAASVEMLTRRGGRPASEWMASIAALLAELDELPGSREVDQVRTDLEYSLAAGHLDRREIGAARASVARIRAAGERLDDPEWATIADWHEGRIDVLEGRVGDGLERIARVAMAGEVAGQEGTAVTAYRDAAVHAILAMEYPTASRMLAAGIRYADSVQQSYCAHLMTASSGVVEWASGRWVEATAQAGQAISDPGCRRGAELGRWGLAYVQMGRGELAAAEASLHTGLEFGVASESIEYILSPLWGLAEVALQAGEPDRAIMHCQEGLDRARMAGERLELVPFVVTGVRAFLLASRPRDAASWLATCRDMLEDFATVAGPALEHGRGLVALSDGTTGVARIALEAAVEGWDAKPRVWEASWARLDLANCLIRSGRYAESLPLIVDVRTLASRLDARALAHRADDLARMARGRVAEEEPWRPLTAREYDVARLISDGLTNAEIADELGIAPKTASSHVEHILAKLGAGRRAEIAAWASSVERVAVQR